MLKSYFKIAWRNLLRSKTFSAINILGLSLGIACSLLIMLWVQDERSVDSFLANGKQLYQVYERQLAEGKVDGSYLTQGLLAEELKRVIPEVQYSSSLERNAPYPYTFEVRGKSIKMDGSFAGADFFRMFSYPLLQGSAETALNKPGAIAISRKMATFFFVSPANAVGKLIRFQNKEDLLVTAVFENLPANVSQPFDFLRNWQDYEKENSWLKSWASASPLTFIQLRKGADAEKVESKIKDFIYRYQAKEKGSAIELGLQPYGEKYLHATFKNGMPDGGRIQYVRLFSLLAIFILLVACINFMNLATARSAKRAKEVGVRKVVGAARPALIAQFLGEALLLTFCSVVFAVILVTFLLPVFNHLTGKQLSLPFGQPVFWIALIGLLTSTAFVAGSYPALFLSSMNPIRVLKGSLKFSRGALFFRKGLVTFQFALAIILIVGVIVIYRQMNFVQTQNLGYDRENLLYIPIEGDLIKKYDLFQEEAARTPGVLSISKMKESPTVIGHHVGDIRWVGEDPNLNTSFADATVGYHFVETMRLKLREGRDFSPDYGVDSASYLINEAAVKKIGYQNPLGSLLWWSNRPGKIIGVLEDFHFNSMHETIEPLIIRMNENQQWGSILIRTEAGKIKEALAGLEKLCKTLNPAYPFTYSFSDQEYSKLYKSEELVGRLCNYFAFLAIFISCLGLFGLTIFTAKQRSKEISVRKVLGASTYNIIRLLSGDFLKPVIMALLIALPIAWYITNQWLLGFAYRIDISWWILAAAGSFALAIAFLTVSFQAVSAALANPVRSLRNE